MMKKSVTLIMALMVVSATTAFAQDALVNEAKKSLASGNFKAAERILKPALTSAKTRDKAAAWNLMSDIKYKQYEKIKVAHQKNDSLTMWQNAVESWQYAQKCDEFDQKSKQPKYRASIIARFKYFGPQLGQAGEYFREHKDNANALKAYQAYLDLHDSPIFKYEKSMQKEEIYHDIAYLAAYLSYKEHSYKQAIKFAEIAKQKPEHSDDANDIIIYALKDNCKNHNDSLDYRNYLKKLRKANVKEERYFYLLSDYYNSASQTAAGKAEKIAWLREEAVIDPNNKLAHALLGEAMMNEDKWDDAIAAFDKAIAVDPTFIQCVFNCGCCYFNSAIELQDKLADEKGMISEANLQKVKNLISKSEPYFLKARKLDPNQNTCNWAKLLSNIYKALGETAKENEMNALIKRR